MVPQVKTMSQLSRISSDRPKYPFFTSCIRGPLLLRRQVNAGLWPKWGAPVPGHGQNRSLVSAKTISPISSAKPADMRTRSALSDGGRRVTAS